MNQILVTEKIYVTPELKKKRKFYKISFIMSILIIIALFSFYAYAEYDRNKNEDISQDILSKMGIQDYANSLNRDTNITNKDNTTINKDDDVWIIAINGEKDQFNLYTSQRKEENNNNTNISTKNTTEEKSNTKVGSYTASNGQTYEIVGTINIPSISVNYPILSETTDALLKVSVCKFWGANPNEVGNLCIAGHNYKNNKFFSNAPKLVVGDIIEVTDLNQNTLKYRVVDKYTVDPNDVSCTSQLTNGKKIVTLITCTNDAKQRIVIRAEEVKNKSKS